MEKSESAVGGVLPYYTDDSNKTRYLSFRATGFSVNESLELTGVDQRTVERWRAADPEFRRYDIESVGELRAQFAASYQAVEFQRNLRAFLLLDSKIIARANSLLAQDLTLGDMEPAERAYLKAIRPMYSSQNLLGMVKAAKGDTSDSEHNNTVNWNQLVINLNKERRTVIDAK